MLIASKYEEIYAPIVKDFVYITDNAYTKEEILCQERKMLFALDFNIQTCSPFVFLERYGKVAHTDNLLFNLARYLVELTLVQYKMLKYKSSVLASSAIYLALKMTKKAEPWNPQMVKHTGLNEQQVRPCAKEIFAIL